MTEWEFLNEVVERADCGILLDVNNICVSSKNHGFDPFVYLDVVHAERVAQIHIARHRLDNSVYFKRHDREAHLLLLALCGGATLGAACETVFCGSKDSPEGTAAKIREWFSRWAEFGWFCEPARR